MDFNTQIWILFLTLVFIQGDVMSTDSTSHFIPCKEGWFYFGEKCYKVFGLTQKQSWTRASSTCSAEGGNLVTIYSKVLQDFLTSFLLLDAQSNLWIGLQDRGSESQYTWDDGSAANYRNWEPGEPSGTYRHMEDCVEMVFKSSRTGQWNDVPCDHQLPFICQSNKTDDELIPDPRFCSVAEGRGFKYLNNCYHVVKEEQSWDNAERYCEETFNGHLVTILNDREQHFVDYLSSNSSNKLWIGIKITEQPIQKWSSGWHMIFSRWSDGHALVNNYCALRSEENLWTSAPCSEKFPFICMTSNEEPPVVDLALEGYGCPDSSKDWKDLGGDFCYLVKTTKSRKWKDANYDCMRIGGTLASIHSLGETNALFPLTKNTHRALFIGLRRGLDNKNIFEWVDGTEIEFQNWDVGEPNDKKEECSELLTASLKWNDIPCDIERGYICSTKKIHLNESLLEDKLKECSVRLNANESLLEDKLKKCSARLSTTEEIFKDKLENCSVHLNTNEQLFRENLEICSVSLSTSEQLFKDKLENCSVRLSTHEQLLKVKLENCSVNASIAELLVKDELNECTGGAAYGSTLIILGCVIFISALLILVACRLKNSTKKTIYLPFKEYFSFKSTKRSASLENIRMHEEP